MTVVRLVATILAVGLAVLAAGLARDVRAWDRAIAQADARFDARSGTASWRIDPWLPRDPARRTLALADDLALRRAEQAFRVAASAPRAFDNGAERSRVRAIAEIALSDVIATGSGEQASRAGNLLGILVAATVDEADASVNERRAADTFDAAIRSDPGNASAKYNLELLLRRIRVVGTREGPGSGSGTRGESRQGAGAGAPGSGY